MTTCNVTRMRDENMRESHFFNSKFLVDDSHETSRRSRQFWKPTPADRRGKNRDLETFGSLSIFSGHGTNFMSLDRQFGKSAKEILDDLGDATTLSFELRS